MIFLMYRQSTSTTGKALAKAIGIDYGSEADLPIDRVNHLIRWGNASRIGLRPVNTLNKRTAILASSDKMESLNTLKRGGVRVPSTHPLNEDSARLFQYPALARMRNHTRGSDIALCLQPDDAFRALSSGSEYLVQYIPTETEYRVHVFGDSVIKISQKVLTDPTQVLPWIRNHGHGYTFRKVRTPPSKLVTDMCVAAVKLLGLDFGAVDVLVDSDGLPWVLEVNTAPGLVESGLNVYAKHFVEALGLTTEIATAEETDDETEAS